MSQLLPLHDCGKRQYPPPPMMMAAGTLRLTAAAVLWTALGGCGGGGGGLVGPGGVPVAPMPPPAPPPSQPEPGQAPPPGPRPTVLQFHAAPYEGDAEYGRNWGLGQIDAATAYARIARREGPGTAPGAGARVAVIDTGIWLAHWEFYTRPVSRTRAEVNAYPTHGTAVASVIAARRNGRPVPPDLADRDFHGVAWGVERLQVMPVRLGTADPDEDYHGIGPQHAGRSLERIGGWFQALAETDFVNMSFGVKGLVENYRGRHLGPGYAAAVRTLAQASAGPGNGKAVLVVAAGNAHGRKCARPEPNCVDGRIDATSPELLAGLPVLERSLRSHVVAVVATDRDRRIASFSNRCGIAAKWCLAAPGDRVPIAWYGLRDGRAVEGYGTASGTSFAAPYVTGGLAVLKHRFRGQMRNEALLLRLYETAQVTPDPVSGHGGTCPAHLDLDGDPARCELSSVLGRGLMDLGAATAPVGVTSIALGGVVSGGGAPATASGLFPGRATGDGMHRSLAGREVALFDTLGAPFWIGAARLVQEPATPGLATRLAGWLAGGDGGGRIVSGDSAMLSPAGDGGRTGRGLHVGVGASGAGHMSLVARPATAAARIGNGTLGAFASTGFGGEAGVRSLGGGARGILLAWQPSGGLAGLHAGWIEEPGALFGTGAKGAFGRLSSRLGFVGASGGFGAGGWRFDMAAEFGRAAPEAGGGLLGEGSGDAFSTAFSAAGMQRIGNGTLRLSVRQPLRVESGGLELSLPVGRTPEGAVLHRRVPLSLEPSGRQIDFGIDWTGTAAPGAVWRIGAVLSREPGHVAGRGAGVILLAGLRFRI